VSTKEKVWNYAEIFLCSRVIFIHSLQRFIYHLFRGKYSAALPTPSLAEYHISVVEEML